jgi:tRNA U34 5-methylaminomethyl-2-thiouridine-forming methyltransferase MnmC
VTGQQAKVEWKNGVPVSTRFADPYYSLENGLEETRHVFLAGNRLDERLRPGFHVAELGVGTGLNLLALIGLVRDLGVGPIRYTGFEAFPLDAGDVRTALAAFPVETGDVDAFACAWEARLPLRTPEIEADFVIGDARETLRRWDGRADAWFLDGFAPARNPELWDAELLAEVARHTAPGGTAATYSAAGEVRRGLAAAGFEVERHPGFGRKRHMTQARLFA